MGYIMKGSGIEELITCNNVCLEGTLNKVLAGKDCYKIIYCHSILLESMLNFIYDAFDSWLENEGQISCSIVLNDSVISLLEFVHDAEQFKKSYIALENKLLDYLPFWTSFQDQLSETGKYWQQYINRYQF